MKISELVKKCTGILHILEAKNGFEGIVLDLHFLSIWSIIFVNPLIVLEIPRAQYDVICGV